jgi:hypothetical protein
MDCAPLFARALGSIFTQGTFSRPIQEPPLPLGRIAFQPAIITASSTSRAISWRHDFARVASGIALYKLAVSFSVSNPRLKRLRSSPTNSGFRLGN